MGARVISPVVVIDPGHGGDKAIGGSSPNNAKGPNGLLEKDLTLDLARRVHKILSRAATVLLTRSDDTNLSLADRAKLARDNNAKMFLSIHMNGFPDSSVDGTEVWVARQASDASTRFAKGVLERLAAATGVKNRGVKQRDLGVLLPARHASETAACLAEISFLTNPEQARRLKDESYLQSIANALAEAVYVGLGGRLTPAQSLAAAVGGYGSELAQVEFSQWANSGPPAHAEGLEWDEYLDDESGDDAPAGALFLAPPLMPKPPPALNAWSKLINFRPPTSVQKTLHARGTLKGWHMHHIEDAHGPINLDYYPVKVTTLPTVKGRLISAETLLDHVRRNLTDFGNKKIGEFDPINQNDHDKFYSDDPIGAILTIKMKLGGKLGAEDGSVIVSEYSPQHWIFSTAWTSEDFDHPVSGNREFGFKEQEGGGYIFYTRGVDRATGLLDAAMSDGVFNTAHALWSSLQEGIADFVNDNGGAATVENPSSRRYDWDEVQKLYFKPATTWTYGLGTEADDEDDEETAYSLAGGASPCAKLKPREVLDKFEFDSDTVLPAHEMKLIDIAKCIIARKKTSEVVDSMLIVGHTDEKGEEKYNKSLGQRRAERVKSHLVATLDRILPGSSKGIVFIVDSGGEAEPASTTPEANRRVEVCLPSKVEPPPPPPPPTGKPKPTLPDVIKRCEQVLTTHSFPDAQKERLQCLMKKVADEAVDASYINGRAWYFTGYFAKGKFPRLSPKDFALYLLYNARRDLRSKLFAASDISDDLVAENLKKLDERILAGIKLVETQTHRNAELNFNNPVLRQMQDFISGLQRGAQPSIYTCYRNVPK
jgi:N-acetylmuramoyl-L-alanine amidase/outer membrane protein OmpA-like peptidoglycan-associated protein